MQAGHLQDREARLHFSDPFHSKGDVRNVIGGWYDAGDFGMYMPSSAVTVAQLLLAYETNPDGFYVGQLAFPHDIERSVAGMPDVLEEVRFNLQWMLRMQRSDGAVYHKKAGLRWPGERTPAWQDRQNRYVFGLSSSSTAQFVGATALAARVYRAFDPDFADTLLEAAQAAFAYLSDNPTPSFREDPQQDAGSGPYRDEEDAEERFWAAAELFKTTGDLEFERHISDHHGELLDSPTPFVTWFNSLGLAHWAYLTAADADPEQKSRVRSALLESADRIVERVEGSGYRSALAAKHYTWASAKNALALGTVLMMANHVAADSTYRIAAMDQIHYVLGRNANSYSYVTGLGTRSPGFVHHRTQRATGVEIPGLLVGGPNKRGGDPLLNTLLKNDDPAPAKAYLDRYGSWSSNEYAIDYNAALFLLTAQVIAAE
jgi:endoglucanase